MDMINLNANRKFHKDNRGAGIVMVLVAIALVMILVSVLMSISLVNFQMKATEKRSKANFYSAEIAMDQIHVGLEELASESIDSAYIDAMQQYKQISNTVRWNNFRNEYLTSLTNELQDPAHAGRYLVKDDSDVLNADGVYTKGVLKYLSKEYTAAYDAGDLTLECQTPDDQNSIVITENGLIMKDLCIGYTDADGYYSEIITDIRIGFPSISFSESSVLPNVFTYCMIGDAGVTFDKTTGAKLMGNIYAGKKNLSTDFADPDNPKADEIKSGIVLTGQSKLTVETGDYVYGGKSLTYCNPVYLISAGQTRLDSLCSLNLNSPTEAQKTAANSAGAPLNDMQLWTTDISLNGSAKGTSSYTSLQTAEDTILYVKDDTTLSKYADSLILSGSYYGYGKGQSAILLNAADSRVNLSGLKDLMLSGNAYISSAVSLASADLDAQTFVADPNNIVLGSSVASKTDQMCFLVPAEVMGILNGNLIGGRNPMLLTDYKDWYSGHNDSGYYRIDVSRPIATLGGKKLADYGLGSSDFKTIFRQIGTENVVYVYLDFSDLGEAAAEQYYKDYMTNSANMLSYLKKYGNTITLGDTDDKDFIRSTGGILTYALDDTKVSIFDETVSSLSETQLNDYYDKQSEYLDAYKGLCSKLTTRFSALSVTEQSRSVYENLIGIDDPTSSFYDLVKTRLTSGQRVIYSYPNTEAPKARAAVVNGDVKLSEFTDDYELIICTGNAEIDRNFCGLVLAGGRITVKESTGRLVCSDEEMVKYLLQCKPDDASFSERALVEDFFINGEAYSNSFAGIVSSSTDDYISLDGIITYVNWTKR